VLQLKTARRTAFFVKTAAKLAGGFGGIAAGSIASNALSSQGAASEPVKRIVDEVSKALIETAVHSGGEKLAHPLAEFWNAEMRLFVSVLVIAVSIVWLIYLIFA
jgi:hypothetical protein